MAISCAEAMSVLGLTVAESLDLSAVRRAWKQRVMKVHPDKSQMSNSDATKQTQRLNAAKEKLVARIQNPEKDAVEEERMASERKNRDEEERKRQARANLDAWNQKSKELREEKNVARREHFMQNRRKRAPESRVHRKTGDCREGRELVKEMKTFFQECFMYSQGNRLLVCDILELFVKSRRSTSVLEINFFKRNSKKLFMNAWPNAIYSTLSNKRCFMHACAEY